MTRTLQAADKAFTQRLIRRYAECLPGRETMKKRAITHPHLEADLAGRRRVEATLGQDGQDGGEQFIAA